MLTRGDVVEIFEDPITCQKFEGKAKLLRKLDDGEFFETWRVRFLEDDLPGFVDVVRVVSKDAHALGEG